MTDNTKLIARLREIASKGVSVWGDLQMQAADALEAAQAQIAGANQLAQLNGEIAAGLKIELLALKAQEPVVEPFQERVLPWLHACFGEVIAADKTERNHRFLEESLELVQGCGCTQSEAHQLVDYVFGRPVGEPSQEVGGVMVTLAALCLAQGLNMHQCGETELARIWTKVEPIRAKQAAKPKHSPLPAHIHPQLDVSGAPKVEMTLIERKAVEVLNNIKAAADDGLIQLPVEMQMGIDVLLMTATQRRVGVA